MYKQNTSSVQLPTYTYERFKKRTVAAEVSDGAGDHPRRRRVRGVTRERPEHLHGAAVQDVRLKIKQTRRHTNRPYIPKLK